MFRRKDDSGAFGRGGKSPVSVRLEFTGQLGPSFIAFAHARAERLGLKGWIAGQHDRAVVHVEGPEALTRRVRGRLLHRPRCRERRRLDLR